MVKGRRVRAVVACARSDDCCSPNPKRRGQFDKAILHEKRPTALTDFFQDVDVLKTNAIKLETDTDELGNESAANGMDTILAYQKDQREDDDIQTDVSNTPVIVKSMLTYHGNGPSTPHRIELHPDDIIKNGFKTEDKPIKANKKKVIYNGQYKDNHKLTEYFPVRRSVRKTKSTVLEERQRTLERSLRSEVEEGLEVKYFSNKGRGVVAMKRFTKGDFVVEYSGDLIDVAEAKKREHKYAQDLNTGCYMYYFKHNNQQYCIDATAETGKLGRLVNHSRNGNLITRTVLVDNKPRLVLIARDDIKEGDEITYDYGDRSKESLKHHPWLAY